MGSITNPQTTKRGGWLGKIDALLDARLQSVKWGKYKIGDLFESSNGDYDIQKKHINGKGEWVITAGLTNNGVLGRSDVNSKIFNANTITIDMFGSAFYRQFPYKMVTHARVFSLKPRFDITDRQGIFIANTLSYLYHHFGYENMCSWEKIKDRQIELPLNANGEIDFDYMEDYVRELERERIRELEAYLQATGLKDYNITPEEELALKQLSSTKWKEYKITDIFNINNTHNILSSSIKNCPGKAPYLCASSENNGVSAYISYDELLKERGNCIFIGGKTFVVSYQQEDFFSNDSHNLALYLKAEKRTRLNQLYLATCIKKSLGHKYTWGDSISRTKIQKDTVNLPLSNDSKPDYALMETLIRAVQKLVIKNVVLYADRRIAATKEAINQHV